VSVSKLADAKVAVSVPVSEYRHQITSVSKLADAKVAVSVESTDTKNVGVGGKTKKYIVAVQDPVLILPDVGGEGPKLESPHDFKVYAYCRTIRS
jgi:hypothetical protein